MCDQVSGTPPAESALSVRMQPCLFCSISGLTPPQATSTLVSFYFVYHLADQPLTVRLSLCTAGHRLTYTPCPSARLCQTAPGIAPTHARHKQRKSKIPYPCKWLRRITVGTVARCYRQQLCITAQPCGVALCLRLAAHTATPFSLSHLIFFISALLSCKNMRFALNYTLYHLQ